MGYSVAIVISVTITTCVKWQQLSSNHFRCRRPTADLCNVGLSSSTGLIWIGWANASQSEHENGQIPMGRLANPEPTSLGRDGETLQEEEKDFVGHAVSQSELFKRKIGYNHFLVHVEISTSFCMDVGFYNFEIHDIFEKMRTTEYLYSILIRKNSQWNHTR